MDAISTVLQGERVLGQVVWSGRVGPNEQPFNFPRLAAAGCRLRTQLLSVTQALAYHRPDHPPLTGMAEQPRPRSWHWIDVGAIAQGIVPPRVRGEEGSS